MVEVLPAVCDFFILPSLQPGASARSLGWPKGSLPAPWMLEQGRFHAGRRGYTGYPDQDAGRPSGDLQVE